MQELKKLFKLCRTSNSSFIIVLTKYFYYLIKGKNIIAHQNAVIKGLKNISTTGGGDF
jgi:hypothetical protein